MSRLSVAALAVVVLFVGFGAFIEKTGETASLTPEQQFEERLARHQGLKVSGESEAEREREAKGGPASEFPDEFARALYEMKIPADRTTPEYEPGYQLREYTKALPAAHADKAITWVNRGPGNVAGRAREILVDPDDATKNTWYVAAVGGGVWKTTDAGASWRQLADEVPNLAVSALVQCPSNPNIMYAGTGESFFSVDVINGNGILKSTDRGETWTPLASTINDVRFNNISRIIVSPTDANLVLASTTVGRYKGSLGASSNIFRSTDGGATWTAVYTEPGTGVLADKRVLQIIADPSNFNIMYAGVYGDGVRKSTNAGLTWTTINNGITNLTGRFEVAVSPVNPSYVFAASQGTSHSELWVSWDGGANWAESVEVGTEPNWLGGQGWYDNTIACDPTDGRILYVGGTELFKITLDYIGATTRTTTRLASYSWPHPDHHMIKTVQIPGGAPSDWFLLGTSDGGVNRTTYGSTGFTMPVTGMVTTQFYGIDKCPGASAYFGGTQDNGTWQSPVDPGAVSNWSARIGGDGYETSWHFDDPLKMIGGYQYNGLQRSLDGGATWASATTGLTNTSSTNAPFITKIGKSQKRPDTIFAVGSTGVWKSTNFGQSWTSTAIAAANWGTIGSFHNVRVSEANPDVVWAGGRMDASGKIMVSTNNGSTFTATSLYPLATMGGISGLATHPTDPNTAYALFGFAQRPKILRTTDLGVTWTDITGYNGSGVNSSNGFPDVAVYDLLVWPTNTNRLWAATEIGIVESLDGGATWALNNANLPAVGVWRLVTVEDQIIAGTHGRGVWSMTDPSLEVGRTFKPLFNHMVQPPTGAMDLEFGLRSAYDSTQVWVDGVKVSVIGANAAHQVQSVSVPVLTAGTKTAFARSFKGGVSYDSVTRTLAAVVLGTPTYTYSNVLNNANDFSTTLFSIQTPAGFTTPALHTNHPYAAATNPIAMLRTPIKIGANTSLSYNEIAMVEPGDPGAVFGDQAFWDYVVVEGSRDGVNWLPVAPGIDANSDAEWLSLYNSGTSPTADQYRPHVTHLNDTFSAGETILLRFRLFADSSVQGWGWAIDDINITNTYVSGAGDVPAAVSLAQNYPNPFNPSTTISYALARSGHVELKIFDARGALVRTLVDGQVAAGDQRVTWDGRDNGDRQVAAGVYLYRLRADGREIQKKMTLVK